MSKEKTQKTEDRSEKSEVKAQQNNTGKIIVKYKKSSIGYPQYQKLTLKALGLKKLNQEKIHNNNKVIQGMIKKVQHLVEVKELSKEN